MSRESEVEGHLLHPADGAESVRLGAPKIGRRLRSARRRRGLELADVEHALRIRIRHLEALEAERFDDLPGRAYARAFLREYATHLGLDGEFLVRALEEQMGEEEEPEPAVLEDEDEQATAWVYLDRITSRLPLRADVVVAVLAVAVLLLLWRVGGDSQPAPVKELHAAATPAPAPDRLAPAEALPRAHPRSRRAEPKPSVARLVLAPTGGDVWLLVRNGSADGATLYEGTVRPGGSLTFVRRQLWIRIGAPWNLVARVNGRVVGPLPIRPGNVIVTPAGVRSA